MTVETCKRLAEHCRKMGDEAGAKMYESRILAHKRKLGIEDTQTGVKNNDKK